jgi:hypothetical protein
MSKKNIKPELTVNDRIVLIHMDDPYSRVPIGTKGTVIRVGNDPFEDDSKLYEVKWDNGSNLALVGISDIWIKEEDLKPSTIREANQMDDLIKLRDLLKNVDTKLIFNFLLKIRESGIVNMFQSTDFIWSGPKFLSKFVELEELKGFKIDKKLKRELIEMSGKTQSSLIAGAIKILINQGIEPNERNINRQIKDLAKKSLQFYILNY